MSCHSIISYVVWMRAFAQLLCFFPSWFRLSNVELESAEKVTDATEIPEGEEVLSVELCECPLGYHGSSCESCAVGYFRQSDGPFGPICAECQCHGHADVCHPITGECVTLVPIDETVLETLGRINVVEYCHFRPDLCKVDVTVEVSLFWSLQWISIDFYYSCIRLMQLPLHCTLFLYSISSLLCWFYHS